MFKKILMLLIVSLLAGCTILHYPKHVSMISANEQRLVFSAEEIACSKILKIDKAEIAHTEVLIKKMSDQIKSSCDVYSLSEYTKKKDDLEKNLASMKSANKLMEKWKGKKMYIDVIGNNEKSRLFEHLVGNNLRNTDVLITTDKKLADVILKIVVKKDGTDTEFFHFLFVYWSRALTSSVELDVSVINASSGEVLYSDTVEGSAHHKKEYFFGLGPINTRS